MRPTLAITCRATPSEEDALSLAREIDTRPGIEVNVDPSDPLRSVARGRVMRSLAPDVEVRYHFPLGEFEISSVDRGDEARDRMLETVGLLGRTGATHMTMHAALPREAASGPTYERTCERIAEVVAFGRERGVAVCLENLRWGATSEPEVFADMLERTGARATIDVGHATSSDAAARGFSAERFVRLVCDRIEGAHVYDREEQVHIAPVDLERISPALDELCRAGCRWWVVELIDADDVRSTAALLRGFLDARCPSTPTTGSPETVTA